MAAKTAEPVAEQVELKVVEENGSGKKPEPETFTWKPKDGGEPIVLPNAAMLAPKNKTYGFLRKLRKLDMIDGLEFMLTKAAVSQSVVERIFDGLPDDEIDELANAWIKSRTGASLGES